MTVNAINTYIIPTTANEVTIPAQPCFVATLNANDNNVTGNGTNYKIGTNVAWTEITDQNADFNTNGTFTAPVTGNYCFATGVLLGDLAVASTKGESHLNTSNRAYFTETRNSGALRTPADTLGFTRIYLTDMDAADTARFFVSDNGKGADTTDVLGGGGVTFFQGFLAT